MTFIPGMDPPSPRNSRHQNQSGVHYQTRKRRQDDDAQQIIRFVRDFQGLQRETTDLRLKRKSILPGIGERPLIHVPTAIREDSDINIGSNLRRKDSLENSSSTETLSERQSPRNKIPSLNLSSLHSDQTDNLLLSNSLDLSVPRSTRRKDIRNKSLDTGLSVGRQLPKRRHSISERSLGGTGSRRLTADVHALPPLSRFSRGPERTPRMTEELHDIPDRPSAPSPSITPPLPDEPTLSTLTERDSPIDYIDTH